PPEGAKKPGQAKSKPPSESGASESDQEPEPQPPPKASKSRDQGMRRNVSRAHPLSRIPVTSATAKTDTDKILVTTRQQKRRLQEGEDVGAGTPLGSGSGGSEQQPTAGSDPDHDADSDDALKPSEPKRLRLCLSPSAESFAKKWEHEVKHAQECMRVAQDRQQRYANKRRRDVTFSLGDSVLLSTKNLRNAPGKARKFLPRQVRFKKRMEYLVKWTGYDDTYNTWEPEAMLAGAPQILARYKAVHNLP
ncbi:hypothetical protein QJQ45_023083, partial [Haematococcus lacustris]